MAFRAQTLNNYPRLVLIPTTWKLPVRWSKEDKKAVLAVILQVTKNPRKWEGRRVQF